MQTLRDPSAPGSSLAETPKPQLLGNNMGLNVGFLGLVLFGRFFVCFVLLGCKGCLCVCVFFLGGGYGSFLKYILSFNFLLSLSTRIKKLRAPKAFKGVAHTGLGKQKS